MDLLKSILKSSNNVLQHTSKRRNVPELVPLECTVPVAGDKSVDTRTDTGTYR